MAGKQPDDDGRVIEGRTLSGPEARQGRYWPFVTGFPFPLGPILTRQTVRHEVSITSDRATHQGLHMHPQPVSACNADAHNILHCFFHTFP